MTTDGGRNPPNEMMLRTDRFPFPLVLITLVGAALRLTDLGQKSFWIDELIALCSADSIHDVRSFFTAHCGNVNPPLYFLLVKLWSIGGREEAWIRILSAVAGIAVIPATFKLGREIAGKATALIASGLVAVSPFLLLHDRELRMYSLLTLLSISTLVYFLRAAKRGDGRDWAIFTTLTILNLYLHYHAVLVLMAEGLLWLWWSRRRDWKPAAISLTVIAGFYSLWLPQFVYQMRNPTVFALETPDQFPVVAGAAFARLGYVFYSLGLGQTLLPWRVVAIGGLAGFLVLAVVGFWHLRHRPNAQVVIAAVVGVPLVVGFLVSREMPRYYVFIAPVFFVVVAEGWLALRRDWWRAALAGLVLIPVCLSVTNYYLGRDFHIMATVDPWREVGQYVLNDASAGDCLATIGSLMPVGHVTNGFEGFHQPVSDNDVMSAADCLDQDSARRLWLVTADPSLADTAASALSWLDARYERVAERRFGRDPAYLTKGRLFRRSFLEYRISVYAYGHRSSGTVRNEIEVAR